MLSINLVRAWLTTHRPVNCTSLLDRPITRIGAPPRSMRSAHAVAPRGTSSQGCSSDNSEQAKRVRWTSRERAMTTIWHSKSRAEMGRNGHMSIIIPLTQRSFCPWARPRPTSWRFFCWSAGYCSIFARWRHWIKWITKIRVNMPCSAYTCLDVSKKSFTYLQ